MPSAQARIQTPNAAAYLARLCGHLTKLTSSRRFPGLGPHLHAGSQPPAVLHAEHSGDAGAITMSRGRLALHASAGELTVRADADTPEDLQRIQDMTASRLARFGRREHLDIQWTPLAGTASDQQEPAPPASGQHGS
jgi:hypothetical protein